MKIIEVYRLMISMQHGTNFIRRLRKKQGIRV